MSQKVKFSSASGSRFYATVRSRVNQYFSQNQLSQHPNAHMWWKTVFFLAGFTGIGAFVGFNICHDALHGTLSGNKKVNRLLGFIFNLVGANPVIFRSTVSRTSISKVKNRKI